ncbi:MAG: phospho-sugar mutase [Egibacteraceae bacterium]
MVTEELAARARSWIADDPDPATRAELVALLDDDDEAGLAAAFAAPLAFGTAGIRGPLGPGPARMNRLVVRATTAGLAARLAEEGPPGEQLVVVGRDARHGSAAFLAETVGVLAAAGLRVMAWPEPVPTPLLAFAVRHLDAAAGVQITASHNPPQDNGYKVFWRGGAQIVDPLDVEIAARIAEVDRPGRVPVDDDAAVPAPPTEVAGAYRRACLALPRYPGHRDLRIAYTPLHGVAGPEVVGLLADAGFADVALVDAQHEPDPDFPTVRFPNPEEPGALDLVLARAGQARADLVLANDPDGDRVAAAIPAPGRWRVLTGDELGCVLAEHLLATGPDDPDRVVARTVVSSQLLDRIAEHHGVRHLATLTGFKWMAKAIADLEGEGAWPVLAYEQALGVMVGGAVRDKDGISAALVIADLAAGLAASGRTLADAVDDLARRHGVHRTAGRSVRLEGEAGQQLVTQALARLRVAPPAALAGVDVAAIADHASGRRTHADGRVSAVATPPQELIGVELADGSKAQVRPSGTEPLLKCYLEVVEPVEGDLAAANARADERVERLADDFLTALGVPTDP